MLDGVRQPFKKVIWPILVGNMTHISSPLNPPKGANEVREANSSLFIMN